MLIIFSLLTPLVLEELLLVIPNLKVDLIYFCVTL